MEKGRGGEDCVLSPAGSKVGRSDGLGMEKQAAVIRRFLLVVPLMYLIFFLRCQTE